MSYSDEIKSELLSTLVKKSCCRLCECYGMTLFLQKDGKIRLKTANTELLRHYRSLIAKCTDIPIEQTLQNGKTEITAEKSLFSDVFLLDKIDMSLFSCENCISSFLRGVFLVSGKCSDPQKEYHIDFTTASERLSYELCRLMINCGFDAKTREKRRSGTKYIVYLKKSGDVEDFLTLIGAQNASLNIMQSKVMKDVRNNINRRTNFETANIKKSSVSCALQIEAINRLDASGKLSLLPPELYDLAIARRENIDMSLSELGAKFGLSRSGVHHRLQKIIDKANEQN